MKRLVGAFIILLLSTASNLMAETQRGPINVFVNAGGGTLSDDGGTNASGISNAKVEIIKIGLGISYAHPINKKLGIGGFVEPHLLVDRLKGDYKLVGDSSTFSGELFTGDKDALGFGMSFGPYIHFDGLWGKDKEGSIGLAAYFTANSLLSEVDDFYNDVVGFGGGLLVNILFTKTLGLHLGLDLQGSTVEIERPSYDKVQVDVFGAVFYGGLTIGF